MHTNLKQLVEAHRRTLLSAELEISKLDKVPGIQPALINSNFPTDLLPELFMRDVIAKPANWAFCGAAV